MYLCVCIDITVTWILEAELLRQKGASYLSLSNFKFPPTVVRECFAGISAPTLGKNKHR